MQTVFSGSNTLSKSEELNVINTLIELKIPGIAVKFALNQVGFDTDKDIVELAIRTSLSIGDLYERLIYLGFNINIDHIQFTESNIVCVPLPIDTELEYLMIYETLMQPNN
jgi:hypothetical protein